MTEQLAEHLSQIQTLWSVVFQAHRAGGQQVASAQKQLLERYGGAVHHYLLGILHDPDAADELMQEFALRFVRGDFRHVHPGRGRFRDFVKMALRHLAIDHHRKQQVRPRSLSAAGVQTAELADESVWSRCSFTRIWREELLVKAWEALAGEQQQRGEPLYHALRCRSEHPELRSAEIAARLTAQLGREVSAAGARQALHRARQKFADYLLDEVIHSLGKPTRKEVEDELIELGLMLYCRPALERRGDN